MQIEYSKYCWHNGLIINETEQPKKKLLDILGSSPILHEQFWCRASEIIFAEQVEKKIRFDVQANNLSARMLLANLKKEVQRVIVRNRTYHYSIVHLLIGLNEKNEEFTFMAVEPRAEHPAIGIPVLIADYIDDIRVPLSPIFSLPQFTGPFLKLIEQEIQMLSLDDAILFNDFGFIAKTFLGSLFIVHQNEVYTPSPKAGASIDILRSFSILALRKNNFIVHEEERMSPERIKNADEIFSASIENGFCFYNGFQESRYLSNTGKLVLDEFFKYTMRE